jgi:tetratricopeptide (TPR) repeat protein
VDGRHCRSAVQSCLQQRKSSLHNKKENQHSRLAALDQRFASVCLLIVLVSIPVCIVAQAPEEADRESVVNTAGTAVPNELPDTVSVARLSVPAKAAKHLDWAQKRFIKSDLTDAVREIDQALKIYPECAQAFSMRAFVKLALKDLPGAIQDAHRAVTIDPHDPASSLALATAYNDANEFSNAAVAAQQALSLNPNAWQGRLELAKSWYNQGQYNVALSALDRIDKDFPDVHLVRANILMRMGRATEATEQFLIFLKQAPDDPRDAEIRRIVAYTRRQLSAVSTKP